MTATLLLSELQERLSELGQLQDGWLDGEGKTLPSVGVVWLSKCFDRFFSDDNAKLPYLAPTEEGGVYAEWFFENKDISLEIDLEKYTGYWHSLNHQNQVCREKELNLRTPEHWNWICEQLSKEESNGIN